MIYFEQIYFQYIVKITRFFGELDGYAALKDDLNGAVNDAYELMKLMKQLKRNLLILPEDWLFYASVMIWIINHFSYKGHINGQNLDVDKIRGS